MISSSSFVKNYHFSRKVEVSATNSTKFSLYKKIKLHSIRQRSHNDRLENLNPLLYTNAYLISYFLHSPYTLLMVEHFKPSYGFVTSFTAEYVFFSPTSNKWITKLHTYPTFPNNTKIALQSAAKGEKAPYIWSWYATGVTYSTTSVIFFGAATARGVRKRNAIWLNRIEGVIMASSGVRLCQRRANSNSITVLVNSILKSRKMHTSIKRVCCEFLYFMELRSEEPLRLKTAS